MFGSFAAEIENWRNEDCIIMILISKDTSNPRIVVQNQMGFDLSSHPVSFKSVKSNSSYDYRYRISIPPQSESETYQPLYPGFLMSREGFVPDYKYPLSVVFSSNKLTLSNSRTMNEFTAIYQH
jgi:hypothetical protein